MLPVHEEGGGRVASSSHYSFVSLLTNFTAILSHISATNPPSREDLYHPDNVSERRRL